MKTLKTTTAAVILLFAFIGSETAQAQTKEETITWLVEYGNEFLRFTPNYIKNVDETNIIIAWRNSVDGVSYSSLVKVDFKSIFLQDVKYESGRMIRLITQPNAVVNIPENNQDWEEYNSNSCSLVFDESVDEKVKENVVRVAKAILHMAKLNGAKELPKVTANTF